MNVKNYFEPSRFWLLLKMELSRSRRGVVMAMLIIFGFLFAVGLLLSPLLDPSMAVYEHYSPYTGMLLIGGFVLSSLAYRDLGNNLKRYNYLTLPVSSLEKFLSMWLLTTAGWIILFTLVYTVYTLVSIPVGELFYKHLTFVPFTPFGPQVTKAMHYYFVTQAVFLAGSAQFKGYSFPKTLLTLVLFAAVCGVLMYFIMKGYFDFDMETDVDPFAGMMTGRLWEVIQWMFWWVLAPLCWVLTYLGLKEQEA